MNGLYKECIEHYFNQLEKDLILETINYEGITGYIVAIAEWWDYIPFFHQEKWMEYTYLLLSFVKDNLNMYLEQNGIGCYGGLCDVLYSADILSRKLTMFKKFNNSLKEMTLPIFNFYLEYYKNELKNGIVKTEYYDLVNGLSGIGMYYLSLKQLTTEEEFFLRQIIKYLCGIHYLDNDREMYGWIIKEENYLKEEDKELFREGYIDLGMAHGIIGAGVFLSKAYSKNIKERRQLSVIKDIIDFYGSLKRINDKGIVEWPSQLEKMQVEYKEWEDDVRNNRVSWCYGSLGILRGTYLIGKFIENKELEAFSVEHLLKISKLPPQELKLDSPIICHGYAGVITVLNLLYRETECSMLEEKISELVKVELSFFNKRKPYGFVNKGKITNESVSYFKEIEQFDILNGATGIILMLYSIENRNSLWEKRLFIV